MARKWMAHERAAFFESATPACPICGRFVSHDHDARPTVMPGFSGRTESGAGTALGVTIVVLIAILIAGSLIGVDWT